MANTQGSNKLFSTPWTTDRKLRVPAAPPGASTIFYAGQAVGRDQSGNMVQMDDTAPTEFLGILEDVIRTQVDPIDQVQVNGIVGDKVFTVGMPIVFTALIAQAAGGDQGRKCYWKFNNEVSYSPGASGNFAGKVWAVKDSTHVEVLPPWMVEDFLGAKCLQTLPASGPIVLTQFDAGKTFLCPATAGQIVTLPPAARVGSGDQVQFVVTALIPGQVTIKPAGSDVINSAAGFNAASYLMGLAQGSKVSLQADGAGAWYVVGT